MGTRDHFYAAEQFEIVDSYIDAASSKLAVEDRSGLASPLDAARRLGRLVIIKKLGGLSRDVAFVSGLMACRGPVHRCRVGCRRRSIRPASVCVPG
jgi:hypothetical protein